MSEAESRPRWPRQAIGALLAAAGLYFLWPYLSDRPSANAPESPSPKIPEIETVTVGALTFTDVTAAAGIGFVPRNGAEGEKFLPETMGGGVAFVDLLDGDGDPDLLFVGSRSWEPTGSEPPSLALYRNDGGGGFTEVTAEAGLQIELYGMGPAVGDVDGDGDLDLYLTAVGENRLLRNDGGNFVDITDSSGTAGEAGEWSTGATFFDADGDGDLDLFVCNYVEWSPQIEQELGFELDGIGRAYGPPQSYLGSNNRLFRNDSAGSGFQEAGIRFTDISEASGIRQSDSAGRPAAKALAVAPIDVDGDRLTDLWVANDTERNFFLKNLGEGQFEEVGELVGLAYDGNGRTTGAMGLDSSFLPDTAYPTLVVGNYADESSSIYLSPDGPEFFIDESQSTGLARPTREPLTFSVFFFDADLDGDSDIVQANGHVEPDIQKIDLGEAYLQPAQLLRHDDGKFVVAEVGDAFSVPRAGRGAAFADLEGDGDLDVVITQVAAAPVLLRNELIGPADTVGSKADAGPHWLRVTLSGRPPNTSALGARLELSTERGRQTREITFTRGYLSQSEATATFGLGDSRTAPHLVVIWPDGSRRDIGPVRVDQHLSLAENLSN